MAVGMASALSAARPAARRVEVARVEVARVARATGTMVGLAVVRREVGAQKAACGEVLATAAHMAGPKAAMESRAAEAMAVDVVTVAEGRVAAVAAAVGAMAAAQTVVVVAMELVRAAAGSVVVAASVAEAVEARAEVGRLAAG